MKLNIYIIFQYFLENNFYFFKKYQIYKINFPILYYKYNLIFNFFPKINLYMEHKASHSI